MPEYLSPGVYVEEVPSGNKPIEGVSTSTAGMVGVTQRGPVNEPTLVTSFGEFTRTFGGYLDHRIFTNNRDLLPYAVEGFFTNGGQRVFITRVVGDDATFAEVDLFGIAPADQVGTLLADDATAEDTTITVTSATDIADGDVLLLRDGVRTETVSVSGAPVGAVITLAGGLRFDHSATDNVVVIRQGTPLTAQVPLPTAPGAGVTLPLASVAGLAAADRLLILDGPRSEYVTVTGLPGGDAVAVTDTQFIHAAGALVMRQVPLLRVHARHPGGWGNSLRIRVRPNHTLQTTVFADAAEDDSPIRLAATFGLAPGSVLDIQRLSGAPTSPFVARQRVTAVNNSANEVDLEGGADADLVAGDLVSSLEFDLIIERLENGKVVESESITNLAMNANHPRYALRVVGAFDRAGETPERAGESNLIRLSDLTLDDAGDDVDDAALLRLAIPFEGVTRQLSDGDDDLTGITDATYIGQPAADPEDRTGIFSLENIDDISIVAAPGRTSQDVQNALINHCTLMRYRFAVLDAQPNARLGDVQTQRQQYDTTYGALYYPWLVIRDPFGRRDDVLNIAPSGHIAGIYARSDVQRGVHKAPANEVVLGIRDLQVRLTKGEQDILNPRHINCLRDFRDMNRGLRAWGARTLSSDPEWKYINVRRLFLFVEKSIERGTQFAVFEPNSEALWATITRSLTGFLTSVWRSGALEGTKPEEAFFVKVGLSTMTQDDIDNGRLIILVGIAPVKPAEFVIFRISQKTREAVA